MKVPQHLGDRQLQAFFRAWPWPSDVSDQLVIDMTRSQFVAPWALVLFSTYALWLGEEHGVDVRVQFDPTTKAGSYAVQAGLYELLGVPRPAGSRLTPEEITAPLTQVQREADIPNVAKNLVQVLGIRDDDLAGALTYTLIELLRNVVQHSRSPVGGVAMAQYYPTAGVVEVAVADTGVGILSTLKPRYGDLRDDLSAVKFSLLPHVSGTFGREMYGSMLNNAGLGLFFVKEIATRASGGLFLASGDSMIDLWGNADGSAGKQYLHSPCGGWSGTFAVLQLRRSRIADFQTLLQHCRDLAAQARRDPGSWFVDFVSDMPPGIPGVEKVKVAAFEENVDEAARVRDDVIIPLLARGKIVVLDFGGIPFATQSFAHALMYKILRDVPQARHQLVVLSASKSSMEAIRAVAAYATSSIGTSDTKK